MDSQFGDSVNAVSPYLSVEDVASRLHVARGTVYRLTSRKQIPYRKPAGTAACLFLEADLELWESGQPLEVLTNAQGGVAVMPVKRKERNESQAA